MISSKSSGHELNAKIDAAFRHAAAKVIQQARFTGTPIIIWRDNRVTEISPDEAEQMLKDDLAKDH